MLFNNFIISLGFLVGIVFFLFFFSTAWCLSIFTYMNQKQQIYFFGYHSNNRSKFNLEKCSCFFLIFFVTSLLGYSLFSLAITDTTINQTTHAFSSVLNRDLLERRRRDYVTENNIMLHPYYIKKKWRVAKPIKLQCCLYNAGRFILTDMSDESMFLNLNDKIFFTVFTP